MTNTLSCFIVDQQKAMAFMVNRGAQGLVFMQLVQDENDQPTPKPDCYWGHGNAFDFKN